MDMSVSIFLFLGYAATERRSSSRLKTDDPEDLEQLCKMS
jgi:hypothetical protein